MVKLFWFCLQCRKILSYRQHLEEKLVSSFSFLFLAFKKNEIFVLICLGDACNYGLLLCCRQLSFSKCFIQSSNNKISNLLPKAWEKRKKKKKKKKEMHQSSWTFPFFTFFKAVPDLQELFLTQVMFNNNNNVHLSWDHQRPERSNDTYLLLFW